MICEILCVGTELLLGDIVNTDGAFIARETAALGFSSYHQTTVGDNPERLREAVNLALSRSDVVILTGGLGPTCDDITKNAVADAFGKKMIFDEATRADIEAYFRRVGRPMTENNLSQCWVPEGAEVFYNKWGTAPGLGIEGEIGGQTKYAAKPWLARLSDDVIYSLNLHLWGIGESAAESILRPMMESSENPTVAPYACEHEVRIRVTARARTLEEAKALCRAKADEIRHTDVGEKIYTETDNPFDAKNAVVTTLIGELRRRGMTFATAESCTAGMIGSSVGDIPGASDVFVGGIISYANDVKERLLGVPHETLETVGAVSEECAAAMAEGARRQTGADIAVSVTGIAGPGGGTPEKPVGTVCFGVATENGTHTETRHFNGKNYRAKISHLTTANAMMLAIRTLRGDLAP